MSRGRWLVLPLFAAWTLLVWGTRIDNIWSDAALTTGGKVGRTLLAVSFVAAGMVVAGVAVRTFRRVPTPRDRWLVGVAGAWTVGVWAVRSIGIVAGDHDLPFTAVHLVLAVVSTALAALAWRSLAPGVVADTERPHVVPG